MHYIYKLYASSDPLEIPQYIGITGQTLELRLRGHINHANNLNLNTHLPVMRWIRKLHKKRRNNIN